MEALANREQSRVGELAGILGSAAENILVDLVLVLAGFVAEAGLLALPAALLELEVETAEVAEHRVGKACNLVHRRLADNHTPDSVDSS